MNKVVIDPQSKARMNDLVEDLELCDEDGRTLGYFIPTPDRERQLYDWAKQEFTDDEITKARGEAGGLTIDEVLEGLEEK